MTKTPKYITIEADSEASRCLSELYKAELKHPVFATGFTDSTIEQNQRALNVLRLKNDNPNRPQDVMNILLEEVMEAEEAYLKGDYKNCIKELAQVGAVVFRAIKWVISHAQKENPKWDLKTSQQKKI